MVVKHGKNISMWQIKINFNEILGGKFNMENNHYENVNISDDKVDIKKVSPLLKFLASIGGRILLTVVFAGILWGILFAMLETDNTVILAIALLGCGFFGWRALARITPDVFLWMPIASWLIYFLVKGLLSIIIGAFVAPFWIGKTISAKVMQYIDVGINTL